MSGSGSPKSSPRKPKGGKNRLPDVPAVKKPNLDEYKGQIDTLQNEVNQLHKKLDSLASSIKGLLKGNSQFQEKRDGLRAKIDAVVAEMDKLETTRNQLVMKIEDASRSGRDTKSKIQGLKKALGFQSSEEIDEKIKQIDSHIMMKRLTVNEENKLISEMRRLERSKPLVDKYANMENQTLNTSQTELLQLKVEFDKIKDAIKVHQQTKRELNDQLSALMKTHNVAITPVREMSDEKDKIKQLIIEKRAKINQLHDEMFQKNREYEAYQALMVKAHRETMAEERKLRNIEKQREEIENALEDITDDSWSPEVQLLTQLVSYLSRLVDRTKPAEVSKAGEEKFEVPEEQDGMIAVKPKKDRENVFYSKPTKKNKAHTEKKSKNPSSPLSHDILILADFARLGVEAPLTVQECPAVLSSLEEKLQNIKKDTSKNKELTERRRAVLISKLEALDESRIPKPAEPSPVEIEAI